MEDFCTLDGCDIGKEEDVLTFDDMGEQWVISREGVEIGSFIEEMEVVTATKGRMIMPIRELMSLMPPLFLKPRFQILQPRMLLIMK